MSAPDSSAYLDTPRVDVNTFQKIWASLCTKAAVNLHAEAVISKLATLDLKGVEKSLNQALENLRLSLSERETQRTGIELFGCSLINTATYLLLRHGGSSQLRSRLEPYVKHPSHARFVELMDVWAWQQEGAGAFVRCLSKIWCHHGMESPLPFNSEISDVACSKAVSLILFRRVVQDSSMACAALQQCVRELSLASPETQKMALLNVVRMCLSSLPVIPADVLAALLRAVRPLYMHPLPLGKFARDVLRVLGHEQQQPGSAMYLGACSAAFACGVDTATIISTSGFVPSLPASLIFNPAARLGYYATCFLQENSPPFLHPDQLSLLFLHASAVAVMSQTLSSNWAFKSDVLAHALLAANDGTLDIREDVSNIRDACLGIMRDHQSHLGLDDAVGFDLDALHFSKLDAATRVLVSKAAAVSQFYDFEESMKRVGHGASENPDNADWPDASNKSTFWCAHVLLLISYSYFCPMHFAVLYCAGVLELGCICRTHSYLGLPIHLMAHPFLFLRTQDLNLAVLSLCSRTYCQIRQHRASFASFLVVATVPSISLLVPSPSCMLQIQSCFQKAASLCIYCRSGAAIDWPLLSLPTIAGLHVKCNPSFSGSSYVCVSNLTVSVLLRLLRRLFHILSDQMCRSENSL
jgi:hypothetical protein